MDMRSRIATRDGVSESVVSLLAWLLAGVVPLAVREELGKGQEQVGAAHPGEVAPSLSVNTQAAYQRQCKCTCRCQCDGGEQLGDAAATDRVAMNHDMPCRD